MLRSICSRGIAASLLALVSGGALAGVPTHAAQGGPFYRAELARPVSQPQTVILDGIAWKCEGSSCSAPKGNSRDAFVCARLARKLGPVTSFASSKGPLEGGDLARCNKG